MTGLCSRMCVKIVKGLLARNVKRKGWGLRGAAASPRRDFLVHWYADDVVHWCSGVIIVWCSGVKMEEDLIP